MKTNNFSKVTSQLLDQRSSELNSLQAIGAVNIYTYTNEESRVLFYVCRSEGKKFWQARPDGAGGILKNLSRVRIVPYRLPDIIKSDTVFIVEGEKDADRIIAEVAAEGLTATTAPGGAGKWKDTFSRYFKDKNALIIPDNDRPGQQHAEKVAHCLYGVANSVFIFKLPGLEKGGDVSDWLDAGNTINDLVNLFDNVPEYKPSKLKPQRRRAGDNPGVRALKGVSKGERDITLFRYACELKCKGIRKEEARILVSKAAERCNPPFPEKEALEKVNSAWRNKDTLSAEDYESIIEEMNLKHAVIMVGGNTCLLNENIDPIFNRIDLTFSTVADFKVWYQNKKILNSGKSRSQITKAQLFLDSPLRREYDGIVFDPSGKTPEKYYNLYKGLAIESRKGDWSLFQEHIREVICNRQRDPFYYLMAWMARLVQDPGGARPGTSVVLQGKQGTGKGIFVTNFGAIFGQHFFHLSNQRHFTGRFNSHLKDALLVFIDEGFWAGDKSAEGVIKGLITEDTITIEPKGKDIFKVKNHVNTIIASNHGWVVPAGLEERRFFVLDVSDKRMKNRGYFRAIAEQMEDGGREAMLYDLLEYNYNRTDLRTIPRTEAMLDQITKTIPSTQRFWFELLRRGYIFEEGRWPEYIKVQELYKEYIEFAKSLNIRHPATDSEFGKDLRKVCNDIKRKQQHFSDGTRPWYYYLPNIDECRELFEMNTGINVKWGDD